MSELSAKRNRFWRMPLSGRVANRKRCEHGPGLRTIAKSRKRGRRLTRARFVRLPRTCLDLSHQSERVTRSQPPCSRASLTAVVRRVIVDSAEVTDLGYNDFSTITNHDPIITAELDGEAVLF